MLRSHRAGGNRKSNPAPKRSRRRDDGVVEPDTRIVFAVMAIGMLVGAMLTTPSKESAKLKSPMPPIVASR